MFIFKIKANKAKSKIYNNNKKLPKEIYKSFFYGIEFKNAHILCTQTYKHTHTQKQTIIDKLFFYAV